MGLLFYSIYNWFIFFKLFYHLLEFYIFFIWRLTYILSCWIQYVWNSWISRSLYDNYNEKQENKIRCIIHYFERIFSHMPIGFVSFERKVLPLEHLPQCISYPKAEFWSNSVIPLCCFEVMKNRCNKQSYLDDLFIMLNLILLI